MLRVGCESSSGRYLLELMPVHRARRAAEVGGRSEAVYVEQCVILWLSRYLMLGLRKPCAGVRALQCRLDTVWWFMLGCVAFSVYCHTAGAHKCKIRLRCVLSTAVDLAAGALCIEWGMGAS